MTSLPCVTCMSPCVPPALPSPPPPRGNHIEAIIAQVKEAVEIEKFENVKKTEMLSKVRREQELQC